MLSVLDDARARIGRLLEAGSSGVVARAASGVWSLVAARGVRRPIALPRGLAVVGVGGAVLGGAGKTPLAIAIARALAARGERVALIAHAYRARVGNARRVARADVAVEVGDDALWAARELDDVCPVFVARRREDALALAALSGASIAIADGLLQARPIALAHAILTVDAKRPWGSGACPPAGDLRAPIEALVAASSLVAAIDGEPPEVDRPRVAVASALLGASRDGADRLRISEICARRVGLLIGVARPERVVAALAREGVVPARVVALADHARFDRASLARAAGGDVELWLTTARCATKLPRALAGRPILALDRRLDVDALTRKLVF